MNKTTLIDAALLAIALDKTLRQPMFEQLAQNLRQLILAKKIPAGAKIPSSRQLASELSVSRVTIVTAFDQLIAEGYLQGRRGAGVFVVNDLPEEISQISVTEKSKSYSPQIPPMLRPFQPTSPDMRLFPHKEWAKLFQRLWANPKDDLLADIDVMGFWPLRQQIAEHLSQWRGINCSPDQVIITSGATEAMQTIAGALLEKSDVVGREDPGYRLFDYVFGRNGIKVQPFKVDKNGLTVEALQNAPISPRCIITTPSRQYPLGFTMPLARRLQLLNWAAQSNSYIIEDDYDSEYRYTGQPLPALMSLEDQDDSARVIYMGSFSKVFSKSLRLGYLVAPIKITQKLSMELAKTGPSAAFISQPVLAAFMASGAFASHIRKMRRTYALRQKGFIAAANKHLSGLIVFEAAQGGMHLVGHPSKQLTATLSDVEICALADQVGVTFLPLSKSFSTDEKVQGIIAGYAGFSLDEIDDAFKQLGEHFRHQRSDSGVNVS